jgi:branched-chain amino acid transport system substrate-binding protein
VKAFRDRLVAFDKNVNGPVATFAFFTYDFVYMLVEAMKKAGTVDDTAKVGKALADLTYNGVIGKICFGKEMRTAISDGGVIFIKDGKVDSRTLPSTCK